jgi:hypothetical protein
MSDLNCIHDSGVKRLFRAKTEVENGLFKPFLKAAFLEELLLTLESSIDFSNYSSPTRQDSPLTLRADKPVRKTHLAVIVAQHSC